MKDLTNKRIYNNTPTIGQQIKSARLKAGLTQKVLAERIGITQPHIAAIEADRENLTVESLKKIAKALDRELIIKFK